MDGETEGFVQVERVAASENTIISLLPILKISFGLFFLAHCSLHQIPA